MKFKEAILFKEEFCTGCSCCTIACSFRKAAVFSVEEASIIIERNLNKGVIKCSILNNCDLCDDLEIPDCIKSCWPGALYLGRKPN